LNSGISTPLQGFAVFEVLHHKRQSSVPKQVGIANEEQFDLRKSKLKRDMDIVQAIGVPLRKRLDLPSTHAVSPPTKKITIQRPQAETFSSYEAHPTLDATTYDDILSVLRNMVLA
jgi:hypothetical protein